MAKKASTSEWRLIRSKLPAGWKEKGWELKAFQKDLNGTTEEEVLRLQLFHAASDGGMRETVKTARAAGLKAPSHVAFFRRLKRSGEWLRWLASEMAGTFRKEVARKGFRRLRLVDSTMSMGPDADHPGHRLHFALDLLSLGCDWHELTAANVAESFTRVPVSPGDLLIGDRNFLRTADVDDVKAREADVLCRMRWSHPKMAGADGKLFKALEAGRRLQAGEIADHDVQLVAREGRRVAGRVIIVKLPAPIAASNRAKVERSANKKSRKVKPESLEAAGYVMLFTTLGRDVLSAQEVLDLYRFRWQIELVFKRYKQLLTFGELPHKNEDAARGWLAAKLLLAMLLETFYRDAAAISPWGISVDTLRLAA